MAHADVGPTSPPVSASVRPTATQGLAAFAGTAALDAISTVAGLALAPVLVEKNPIARRLFEHVGVIPTTIIVTVLAGIVIFTVTEFAVQLSPTTTDDARYASIVRVVGYGIPSVLSLIVATNNFALLLSHGSIAW